MLGSSEQRNKSGANASKHKKTAAQDKNNVKRGAANAHSRSLPTQNKRTQSGGQKSTVGKQATRPNANRSLNNQSRSVKNTAGSVRAKTDNTQLGSKVKHPVKRDASQKPRQNNVSNKVNNTRRDSDKSIDNRVPEKNRAVSSTKQNNAQNPQRTQSKKNAQMASKGKLQPANAKRSTISAHRPTDPPKKYKPMPPKKRKRRKVLIYIAVLFAVLLVGIVLSLTVLFKIEEIKVTGDTRYNTEDIIENCGMRAGDNLFLINKKLAVEQLDSLYPYIEDVDISRKIPSTVIINVTEGTPSFTVFADNMYYIMSSKNRVLEIMDKLEMELPLLKGVELSQKELGKQIKFKSESIHKVLDDIMKCLRENDFTKISEINLENPAAITLNYDNRIKIKLGSPENVDYKIRMALKIITEQLDKTETGTLDVSLTKSYFNKTYDLSSKPNDEDTSSAASSSTSTAVSSEPEPEPEPEPNQGE